MPNPNEETIGFWERCEKGELSAQRCSDCGRHRFPALPVCPNCLSDQYQWSLVSGRGIVYTYVIIHGTGAESELPGFTDYPYGVAVVELDDADHVRMASYIAPEDLADLEIGQRVGVTFVRVGGRSIPVFRPDANVR